MSNEGVNPATRVDVQIRSSRDARAQQLSWNFYRKRCVFRLPCLQRGPNSSRRRRRSSKAWMCCANLSLGVPAEPTCCVPWASGEDERAEKRRHNTQLSQLSTFRAVQLSLQGLCIPFTAVSSHTCIHMSSTAERQRLLWESLVCLDQVR